MCSEWMRPPARWRASMMQTRLPAPESVRAAERPAAPAPMMRTSYFTRCGGDWPLPVGVAFLRTSAETTVTGNSPKRLLRFADHFAPGQLTNQGDLLVDRVLRG